MKSTIFITSCDRDRHNGKNDAARETWIKTWSGLVDYKFLIGEGAKDPLPDELLVDAPDTYDFLASKCRAGYRLLDGKPDHVFQATVDTYIVVPRLLASGYEAHDYLGCACFDPPYAGGGCGYWLSRKSYQIVAGNRDKDILKLDDIWIGQVLRGVVPLSHDDRYWTDATMVNGVRMGGNGAFPYWQDGVWDEGWITAHLGRGTNNFDPKWMKECHELYLRSHP